MLEILPDVPLPKNQVSRNNIPSHYKYFGLLSTNNAIVTLKYAVCYTTRYFLKLHPDGTYSSTTKDCDFCIKTKCSLINFNDVYHQDGTLFTNHPCNIKLLPTLQDLLTLAFEENYKVYAFVFMDDLYKWLIED